MEGEFIKTVDEVSEGRMIKDIIDKDSDDSNRITTEKQFLEAIDDEDIDTLRRIINSGFDIHYNDDGGLVRACLNNKIKSATLLLDSGADINARGGVPLIYTIEMAHEDLLRFLINRGADLSVIKEDRIDSFIKCGDLSITKILIQSGLEITIELLVGAVDEGNLEIVKLFVESNPNLDLTLALYQSLKNVNCDIAKYLLEAGANLQLCDQTVTCDIAKKGGIDVLKILLNHDFSLDPDTLYFACIGNQLETVKFLLDYGCNSNDITYQEEIIFRCKYEIIELLSKNGMTIDKDQMLNAISNGDERVFYLLYNLYEYDPVTIFNYLPIISTSRSGEKIMEFLLKRHEELINTEVVIELYRCSLFTNNKVLFDLLIKHLPLPEDTMNNLYLPTLSSDIIDYLQSKGFFQNVEPVPKMEEVD